MTETNMALCFKARKKRSTSKRNDFFMENNRLLLEELISSFDGKSNPIRIFSEKEIIKATNNYDPDQFLGYISVHTWYKGRYENQDVLIKKFMDWPGRKHCATEIAVLSQIKHKNVVELLGCCLETEFPILVFEYCFHEILSHRIHRGTSIGPDDPVFPWEKMLSIASEIAHAITYLHSFTSRPIIHSDITAQNIVLDRQGVAKLANFSLCIPLPFGKTDAETEVLLGTHWCLAPEYISKGRVSEKTDVFSFGVLLFEILAKQMCLSCYGQLDSRLKKVNGSVIEKQLKKYVELANRCTRDEDNERPTMKEVTEELWRIKKIQTALIGSS